MKIILDYATDTELTTKAWREGMLLMGTTDKKIRFDQSGGESTFYETGAGGYMPPPDGIPLEDLEDSVQNLLGLTNTALQSFTETDPTVPAWAKEPNKPTYTASEVGAATAEQGAHLETQVNAVQTLVENLELVKNVAYNNGNGDVTFTFKDNSTLTINVFAENLAQDVTYDATTKELIITKKNGAPQRISIADLVDIYTGHNGTHIQVTVGANNVITAVLKAGTVTETELVQALKDKIDGKLGKTEQAADSAKLGGKLPSAYANALHEHASLFPLVLSGTCYAVAEVDSKLVEIDGAGSHGLDIPDTPELGTELVVKFRNGSTANNPTLKINWTSSVAEYPIRSLIGYAFAANLLYRMRFEKPAGENYRWNIIGVGVSPEFLAAHYATTAQGEKADSAFQKPSTGISITDLEAAVQASLGKADTALQEGAKGETGRNMFSVSATTSTTAQVNTNASGARVGDYLLSAPTIVNRSVTIAGTARAAGTLWEISTLPASGNIMVTARGTIQGATGAAGTNATASSTENVFQQSTSGTTVPTGTWSNSPLTAIAGQFMWTRTTITWNNGGTSVIYSVAANGADGGNGDSSNIVNYDIVGNYTPLEDDIQNAFALTGASVLMGMYENSTIESTIGLGSYIATRTLQNIGWSMESTITIFVIRDDGSVSIGLGWGTSFNWKIDGGGGIPGMEYAGIGTVPVKTANGIEWMTYQQWYNNYGYY